MVNTYIDSGSVKLLFCVTQLYTHVHTLLQLFTLTPCPPISLEGRLQG